MLTDYRRESRPQILNMLPYRGFNKGDHITLAQKEQCVDSEGMDAVQELVPAHVVPSSDDKMSPRADTVMVTLFGLDIFNFVYWQC